MAIQAFLRRIFPKPPGPLERAGLKPGVTHYLRESGAGTFTRFHLRIDQTGGGLLLANATAAARLQPSGVIIAKGLLDGEPETAIAARLERLFHGLRPGQAAADVAEVARLINTLDSPGDNYPIVNLADPRFSPKTDFPDRPLSADVPLAEPERLTPILDRLWELGIPHVTIIAGEQPKTEWLVRAIERAEDLGVIAGIRCRGSQLADAALVKDLAQAGLDHVNVLYLSARAEVHDALAGPGDHAKARELIARAHDNEVCAVVETALVASTMAWIEETLDSLDGLGVHNAGFFAVAAGEEEKGTVPFCAKHPPGRSGKRGLSPFLPLPRAAMIQAAKTVEEASLDSRVRLLWYPPLRFSPQLGLAEQVRGGPRSSGDLAIRVQPDGSVLAARGPARVAGNLLHDSWETIEASPVYDAYRRRLLSDTHCDDCPGLAVCAAECPRDPAGWAEVLP